MLLDTLDFSVNWLLVDHCFLMDLWNLHYWNLTLNHLFLIFKVSYPQKVASYMLTSWCLSSHYIFGGRNCCWCYVCSGSQLGLWIHKVFSWLGLAVSQSRLQPLLPAPQSSKLFNSVNSSIWPNSQSDQSSILSAPWLNQHNKTHGRLAP